MRLNQETKTTLKILSASISTTPRRDTSHLTAMHTSNKRQPDLHTRTLYRNLVRTIYAGLILECGSQFDDDEEKTDEEVVDVAAEGTGEDQHGDERYHTAYNIAKKAPLPSTLPVTTLIDEYGAQDFL
jgi:hypothetical protein